MTIPSVTMSSFERDIQDLASMKAGSVVTFTRFDEVLRKVRPFMGEIAMIVPFENVMCMVKYVSENGIMSETWVQARDLTVLTKSEIEAMNFSEGNAVQEWLKNGRT